MPVTLRDAARAAQSLSHSLTGDQQRQAAAISGAIGALADRLEAIEDILRTLAEKAVPSFTADDAVRMAEDRRTAARSQKGGSVLYDNPAIPSPLENHIRRILGRG